MIYLSKLYSTNFTWSISEYLDSYKVLEFDRPYIDSQSSGNHYIVSSFTFTINDRECLRHSLIQAIRHHWKDFKTSGKLFLPLHCSKPIYYPIFKRNNIKTYKNTL